MRIGISLASRCYCCKDTPQCETILHLFLESQLATTVWTHFCNPFQVLHNRREITGFLSNWIDGANMDTAYGFCRVMCCVAVLWCIWLHKNGILHEEAKLNEQSVIHHVLSIVKDQLSLFKPKKYSSTRENLCLSQLGLLDRIQPVIFRRQWLTWQAPNTDIKLNFDASYTDGSMGGGGVFRDPKK